MLNWFLRGALIIGLVFLQRVPASRNREACPRRNSGNAIKSSEWRGSNCSKIPAGISRASPVDQRSGLGSGVGWSYFSALADFEFSAFLVSD